jgi:hypothetical protein
MDIPGVLAEHKVLPILADCALAPFLSSCCGIDSIANPYLNNNFETIIAFPGVH